MSYGLVYTLPFASKDGRAYEVKIEREGYTGESKELKGQTSPFIVTIDSEEFIYTPTRFSTATLAIFGGDYLQDLFSTDYRMHRITLYADGITVWCGFIKPELYTQEYSSDKFNLELNCYSAMSVLEYIEYKQAGEERGFISLWELLKKCIEESQGLYTAVHIPHVYGISQSEYNNWRNPLEQMMISEQNFFDEDDNAMSMLEVLKEIMKLMNWTCVDWRGELYFVDVNNEIGEYYKYTADMSSYTQIQADEMNVQDIGFAGSDHTLDVLPGYNKASVRCSNYPVGEALPNTSFDNMELLTVKDEKTVLNEGYRITHYKFYQSKQNNYKMLAYKYGAEPDSVTELSPEQLKEEIDASNKWDLLSVTGAIPIKWDEYQIDNSGNANITDYDYEDEIKIKTSRGTSQTLIFSKNNTIPILQIKGSPAAYSQGAFVINFSTYMLARMTSGIVDYDFHFRLRVGNKYFHGKTGGADSYWDDNSAVIVGEHDNNLKVSFGNDNNDYYGPYTLLSSRQLNDGLNDIKGYICRIPDDMVLLGEVELTIFGPYATFVLGGLRPEYFSLKDFEFNFNKFEDVEDEDSDSDRIYENVVNEDYINELDEIEFKISSYNDDGACYSKVTINNSYLTNNLYCGIVGENIRPEEFLIRRIVDHYSVPKIKLTQVLKRADIKPYTVLSDKYSVNKKYINAGGEIDYRKNRFNCIMIEI